ncbi:hypothetical protein [Archangium primigenium]|uniref:hypothetical protein n=1 Tax=[Archangium] primigenium TaxID=2792470 RepID=UPI00195A54E6|nr:hypothetical protein [Archangium primigenium]MBM7113795.1 hypothetical protein [Archangium primigenium]
MTPPFAKRLGGLALTALIATGCEPPPVVPTADVRQKNALTRIEGQLVVQGRVRGNAIVLLYDTERPPPPQGTGRPVSFTVVPREQLFGPSDVTSTGPFTAPYAFSQVAPGSYFVRGFIDVDTCVMPGATSSCRTPDFIPWYTITSEPNTGDVGGAALDTSRDGAPVPRVLNLTPRADGTLPVATGVNVSFSADQATVPLERPVFSVDGTGNFSGQAGALFTLRPRAVEVRTDKEKTGEEDSRLLSTQGAPAFFVRLVDDNNDGQPDGDKKLEIWPRVLVRKLTDVKNPDNPSQELADENDLDRNGLLDKTGVEHAPLVGDKDGQPDRVILLTSLDVPPEVRDRLMQKNANGTWNFQPVPSPTLLLTLQPQAVDARDPLHPVPLKAVPSGRYAITLVQFTGQTWRVPNELSASVAPSIDLLPSDTQSFTINVP